MGRRMNKKIKKALIVGAVIGAAAGILITFAAAKTTLVKKSEAFTTAEKKLTDENSKLKKQVEEFNTANAAANLSKKAAENWELVLVNKDYPLDKEYVPELTEVGDGKSVDSRIAEDTKAMLKAAEEADLRLFVVSGYRSYDDQYQVYQESMDERINGGMGSLEAYEDTKLSVAVPGYSEHATGLALDICDADYIELDDSQADTEEAKWLAENCQKYGFILRYPKGKEDVTGIVYEPWHFRYVGKEAAAEIMKKGITLEEYLGVK